MKPGEILRTAPKIYKEDCRIDWEREGRTIVNLIRGLSPFPGAFTLLEREKGSTLCKIYAATHEHFQHREPCGTLHSDGKKVLKAAVADGYVHIGSIQLEGKRRMETPEFLAGFHLTSGQVRFS
jgi:methionyl-tRNA formyltransferase